MQVIENGVIVPYSGGGEVRRGDRYICPSCGKEVISNFGEPYDLVHDIQHFTLPLEAPA
jgi:hypothetical protein